MSYNSPPMKNILVPSDFTGESLRVAEHAIQSINEDLTLMFVHLFRMPDGIQDLLFTNFRKVDARYVPEKFRYEAEELKEMFSYKVKRVKIDFFYGNTLVLFKNYLDHNQVSLIAFSSQSPVGQLCKSSIDPLPIVKKSGYPFLDVDSSELASPPRSVFARA